MRRLQVAAGSTFMAAWIVGLILANGSPSPSDPAATIASYYDDHQASSMIATLLIDGVAGLAIIALTYCLWRYLAPEQVALRRALLVAGIGAGVVSLAQMVVGEVMAHRAAHGSSPDNVQALFKVLNNLDTVKIVFLAILIATTSILARRSGAFPHWLAVAGLVFAPLLAISGLAFPLDSDPLYTSLTVTLIGLLAWVVAVTVAMARRTAGTAASPGEAAS